MSKFNLDDHVRRIRASMSYSNLNVIPFDDILKMSRRELSDHIPPDFITVDDTSDLKMSHGLSPFAHKTVYTELYVITEEMFNNIRQYSSMMVDLERREEEVKKKEKEFKKLKNDLKHISELSKNVNQLFKGL